MPDEKQEYINNNIRILSDDALSDIIFNHSDEYEKNAFEAAEIELYGRYEKLFSMQSGDDLSFGDVITDINIEDIGGFIRTFLDKKKADLSLYEKVLYRLLELKPEENADTVLSVICVNPKTEIWETVGINIDTDEEIDLKFLTWQEWLTVKISKEALLKYGKNRIAALSLLKITANGFDENDTIKCQQNINNDFGDNDSQSIDNYDETELQPEELFITEGVRSLINNQKEHKNDEVSQIRPWVRFFARTFDNAVFISVISIIWMLHSFSSYNKFILFISPMVLLIWVPLEAMLLSIWGTTPGKSLFRINVLKRGGGKLSFKVALFRGIRVWAVGLACGLDWINIITKIISYNR